MKEILYIFILLCICMLIRSVCIELKEYYENSDECKRLFGKEFHDYINKQMKDHGRGEKNNSLNSYKYNNNTHYELKKENKRYVNLPALDEPNVYLKTLIDLNEKKIMIAIDNSAWIFGGTQAINLYNCEFIRNNIPIKEMINKLPPELSIKIEAACHQLIGGPSTALGSILNMFRGLSHKSEVNNVGGFQKFKYGEKHPITCSGHTQKVSLIDCAKASSESMRQLEIFKSKKDVDGILKIEKQIQIQNECIEQVRSKFNKSPKSKLIERDYIIPESKERMAGIQAMLIQILYGGIFSSLPYECRTTPDVFQSYMYIGMLNLFDIQPAGSDKRYTLFIKLIDDPKNPNSHSGTVVAKQIEN